MSRPYWRTGTRYPCTKCKNAWGGARWHVRGSKIGDAHWEFRQYKYPKDQKRVRVIPKSGSESTNIGDPKNE